MKIAILIFSILLLFHNHLNAEEILLTTSNSVYMTDDVNPLMSATLANLIRTKPIKYLVIYSNGGIIEGIEDVAAAVTEHPEMNVLIIRAASAAAAASQMVKNDRLIVVNGSMMFHRSRSFISSGYFELSKAEEKIEVIRQVDKKFADHCFNRMIITRETYDSNTVGKDWELTPQEALKIGAVDRIVTARCSPKLKKLSEFLCDRITELKYSK